MYNREIYNFLENSKGVIHIGASTGQEAELYADMNLPVLWIEANPNAYVGLLKNIIQYPNQKALNYLITDKNSPEQIKFNIANNSESSSIFELKHHTVLWPDIRWEDFLYLHQYTLPSALLAEGIDITEYDTLILDVQGAELKVLEGMKKLLRNFKYIRCEATNMELYEGQCLDFQLTRFLSQHGFEVENKWAYPDMPEQYEVSEILYRTVRDKKNCLVTDPETGIKTDVRVGVVTSNPRLGFQVHGSVMFQCFGKSGWPIARVSGAFWEQSIQNGLNNLIYNFGCDYIISVDYDSIFDNLDVQKLILLATRYPDADCLSAWQAKRHDGPPTALVGWLAEDGNSFNETVPIDKVINEEITKVDHTVFGLTLIKVDALLKVPKPWFQSFPNDEGEWELGKQDADGYFFRKWREYGNSIYQANSVKIGHLDEVVLWIDDELTPVRQSLSTYHKQGRPF